MASEKAQGDSHIDVQPMTPENRKETPKPTLTTLPPEIVGLIVDHLLPIKPPPGCSPWDLFGQGMKGCRGLIRVNAYFESEVYAAVRRANAWVRNICFDDGNDGDEYLMTRINKWIDPRVSDVTYLILNSDVRALPCVEFMSVLLTATGQSLRGRATRSTWFLVEAFVQLSLNGKLDDSGCDNTVTTAILSFIDCVWAYPREVRAEGPSEMDKMIFRRLSKRLEKVGLWPKMATLEKFEQLFTADESDATYIKRFHDIFEAHRAARRRVRP